MNPQQPDMQRVLADLDLDVSDLGSLLLGGVALFGGVVLWVFIGPVLPSRVVADTINARDRSPDAHRSNHAVGMQCAGPSVRPQTSPCPLAQATAAVRVETSVLR